MFSTNSKRLNVNIIFNKSNTFGLLNDAEVIKYALLGKANVKFIDPLEHPAICDVNIHLEVPINSFIPWASYNIFVMNPEWYINEAYDPYMINFDKIITKEELQVGSVLPWALLPFQKNKNASVKEFLYLLGGSKHKRDFAKKLLPKWKDSYPVIHVYSIEPLEYDEGVELSKKIVFHIEDLTKEKRQAFLQLYQGHICCSYAEGFGYTAAEAEYVGAFTILNTLPVYLQDYNNENIAFINTEVEKNNEVCKYASFVTKITNLQEDLDSAIAKFSCFVYKQTNTTHLKLSTFKMNLLTILNDLPIKNPIKNLAPILDRKDCPLISIITLMYNRRKFFELARHNMILTDYPKNKIQWIIVEDSDDVNEQASDKIIQAQNQFTDMDIKYIPLLKKTPISQKRNIGVEHASHDIILFMDDDDHYPETSFRRRVAWLTKHPLIKPNAVVCTTIACYDLNTGVSAVNCPPFNIPLGQRISEATLTFYKSWFLARKFESNIQVGEGESFLRSRESEVLEIPPQQIIVAFSHGKNTSSRRIPSSENVAPSCFWGFPKEYLTFVHSLAGVNVVME